MTVYAFDVKTRSLERMQSTTLADKKILERKHLQAALAKNISIIGDDLLVIQTEFSKWADSGRSVDILCLDTSARPVVIELKRNESRDSELQAIRYAAMVSTIPMPSLIREYAKYLNSGIESEDSLKGATDKIVAHCHDPDSEEPITAMNLESRSAAEPRIILLAENFSKEVTTTALWLSNRFNMDIKLFDFTAYEENERIYLEISQVLPVPKSDEYLVSERAETIVRRREEASKRDMTKYRVEDSEPLPKNHLVLKTVQWYVKHDPTSTWDHVRAAFPDALQGTSRGVVRLLHEARKLQGKDEVQRYFFEDVLKTPGDNIEFVVSRGWDKTNIPGFINSVQSKLGVRISEA